MQSELERIQEKIDEITEEPVYSSGHAFICFDSLTAAYKVMKEFKNSPFMRFKLRMKNLMDGVKENILGNRNNNGSIMLHKDSSTFQKFNEDYNIGSLEDNYFIEENSELEIKQNAQKTKIVFIHNLKSNKLLLKNNGANTNRFFTHCNGLKS